MTELHYKTCEKFGREVADIRSLSIRHSKITILRIDEKLTRIAGTFLYT